MRPKLGKFELHAAEMLRALRGGRSQRAFAHKLGYRANPITDWEHGRRFPTAEEALRAAQIVRIDLARSFTLFHPTPPPIDRTGRISLAPWLNALRGTTSVTHLAQRTGRSRTAVARWLNGTAHPRLPDFLRCVDAITGRLSDLIAALVPIESVPSLLSYHLSTLAARRLAFEQPWTEAVLRVLETKTYQALQTHVDGLIAARLEIPLETEQECLASLTRAAIITLEDGIWHEKKPLTVNTRSARDDLTLVLQHWTEVARRRISERRSRDLYAYNVMSVSVADYERIRDLLRRTFREIQSIVAASEPSERVALLNLQLLGFD
ncbi:MAG TPA: DUF4423 domain-containing protein [Polyangiaceae bacterium]